MPSKIVTENKDIILDPDKTIVAINGKQYKIKPLSDIAFQHISETLAQVLNVIGSLGSFIETRADGTSTFKDLGLLLTQVPMLLSILAPASTKILAQTIKSLDGAEEITTDWVQENVYAIDRVSLLDTTLKVNGVYSLLEVLVEAKSKIPATTPPNSAG